MKIFDAYDKASIRLHFKEYIEAEVFGANGTLNLFDDF